MDKDEAKKVKVLIVDDDSFLLNMYSLKFQKAGFEVATSASADDVLRRLKEGFAPDIILLDIIMPGMSGLELLDQIRKDKLIPNAVVFILSNQGQTSDIEQAKKLNVDGYIVKATTIPSEVVAEVVKVYKANATKTSA